MIVKHVLNMNINDKKYMQIAINKAKEGINLGQSPFGACIVKNNKLISCEHNQVWMNTDITAHAEVTAIRKACLELNTIDLSGCIIYSTCEPCPMCFSSIHWSKINKIIYGASIKDAKKFGFNELDISNKTLIELSKSTIYIESDFMKPECLEIFKEWKKLNSMTY